MVRRPIFSIRGALGHPPLDFADEYFGTGELTAIDDAKDELELLFVKAF